MNYHDTRPFIMCPTCGGNGVFGDGKTCSKCQGAGVLGGERKPDITISTVVTECVTCAGKGHIIGHRGVYVCRNCAGSGKQKTIKREAL